MSFSTHLPSLCLNAPSDRKLTTLSDTRHPILWFNGYWAGDSHFPCSVPALLLGNAALTGHAIYYVYRDTRWTPKRQHKQKQARPTCCPEGVPESGQPRRPKGMQTCGAQAAEQQRPGNGADPKVPREAEEAATILLSPQPVQAFVCPCFWETFLSSLSATPLLELASTSVPGNQKAFHQVRKKKGSVGGDPGNRFPLNCTQRGAVWGRVQKPGARPSWPRPA